MNARRTGGERHNTHLRQAVCTTGVKYPGNGYHHQKHLSASSFPRVDFSLRGYLCALHDSLLEFTQRPRAFIYEFAYQVKWLGQCMRLHPEPRKAPKHNTINVWTKLETCKLRAKASQETCPPTTEQVRPASLSQPHPTRARHSQPGPARASQPASQPVSQSRPTGVSQPGRQTASQAASWLGISSGLPPGIPLGISPI